MGSNHMHDLFRNSKKEIPTHDPQTGELNPYYEELTGEPNPMTPTKSEDFISEDDALNRFLLDIVHRGVSVSDKIEELEKLIKTFKY